MGYQCTSYDSTDLKFTTAVPALATPPLVWHQCPDPRPGWRVSVRPQPTRAPQGEAMALGSPRGAEAGPGCGTTAYNLHKCVMSIVCCLLPDVSLFSVQT